jgi:Glycoside Hydrolase Family 113
MRRWALLVAVAVLAAGCRHPLSPDPAPRAPQTAASLGRSDWPVLGADRPVLGVNLYALSDYPAATVRADGTRMIGYIRHVLKADAVAIVWNLYSPNRYGERVGPTRDTLSARNVGILTRIAQRAGLEVEYRPVILVPGQANPWAGLIVPYPVQDWFSNYYRAELPYLKMAQRLHVSEFVTGTELMELNTSTSWPFFFADVSRVYHGVISYSAWDGNYFGHDPSVKGSPAPPFQVARPELLPAKYLGMDMYWHLDLPAAATTAQVTAAWDGLFAKVPASVLRRTAIDETGIQAREGAYQNPGDLTAVGRRSEQVQASWFTAACRMVARYHMRGVFFWKVDLTDNPAHPATSLSTFEGRRGVAAISDCARILH